MRNQVKWLVPLMIMGMAFYACEKKDDECTNLCDNAGDMRCSGDVIQTCTADADGCLDWADGTNCGDSSEVCEESGSTATCEVSCNNVCTTAGVTQCASAVIQTCTADTDGCLDWVDTIDCADGSPVQTCSDATSDATCID